MSPRLAAYVRWYLPDSVEPQQTEVSTEFLDPFLRTLLALGATIMEVH